MKWTVLFLIAILVTTPVQGETAFEPIKHPVRSLKYWGNYQRISLIDKVLQKAPAELIDYLQQDNLKNGWPNVPKPVDVPF